MAQEEQTYWVATLENCPIEQLTIEGICFPRRTMIRKEVRGMARIVGERPGGLVRITPEKAAKIKKKIATMVSRWRGTAVEKDGTVLNPYGRKGDVLDLTETVPQFDHNGKQIAPAPDHPKAYVRLSGDIDLAHCVQFKLVEKPEDAPAFYDYEPKSLSGSAAPAPAGKSKRRRDGDFVEIPSSGSQIPDPAI